MFRPYPAGAVLALAAGVVTVLFGALPSASIAYRSVSLHVALETAATLIALLVAYLILQRFLISRRSSGLLLFAALLLLATTNLAFAAVPSAFPTIASQRFATWSALVGCLLAAAALAGAALLPGRRIRRPARAALLTVGACMAALFAVGLAIGIFSSQLPVGIDPSMSPAEPHLNASPWLLGAQLVAMGLFLAASIGFLRQASQGHDALMGWLSAATLLAAFSRLNYFLFPSLYTDWVYVGDAFRLGFYLLLLVGAALEIHAYERNLARTVALEVRRGVARDLHDGLAQELAYISLQSKRLAVKGEDRTAVASIAAAAERALDEARHAISALTRVGDEPLEVAIAEEAENVAARAHVRLELSLETGLGASRAARDALTRMVREAVTNATRHGQAGVISVALSSEGGLALKVVDDGRGFDLEAPTNGGFGLQSMRERVERIGGKFRIESSPDAGTLVEAVLPS